MNREELVKFMSLSAKPAGPLLVKSNDRREDRGEPNFDLQVGLEFDTSEEAQEFYNLYATQTGFRIRIGQLYRSRVDGSVISRRFVCSKEGFQTASRTGCHAFIRVQKNDSGKWVIANANKDHNHELEAPGEITPHHIQRRTISTSKASIVVPTRTGIRLLDDEDEQQSQFGVVDPKRPRIEVTKVQPYKGLEFSSANEAYKLYSLFAASTGFKVRIGQLFRSKNDGSITSRRFVCSKEGHQHPSRVGCGAFMRIQRKESGRWVVDRFQIEHNHELDSPMDAGMLMSAAPKITFKEEEEDGLENLNLIETNGGFELATIGRQSTVGGDWYSVILEYLQSRQAEDTGFFYAVEVDHGQCMSIFWADGRSRFSCSQFGDSVVFDTEYRSSGFLVPFSFFVGINHHRQPVLLGCAVIAEESEKSFTWVLQTWLRAMSGRQPLSIIADQDMAIQQAIAQVFPGTHHRFSSWQMKAQERQYLGALLSMNNEFKYEYETCIHQSQTSNEFDSMWNVVLSKYNLKDNVWLQEMYRMRKSWVPLYIRSNFFAGIPIDGNIKPFFSPVLIAQTLLNEFIFRYEKALELRREEERKMDFDSFNAPSVLPIKGPIEEQGRRLYTKTLFETFDKELSECSGYVGIKINAEGPVSRYLVQNGSANERTTVMFNAANINVSCSCKMFDFEGLLCRHALKVFQIMNIRELPSRYILHRWTVNAKHGILRDVGSGGDSQDFRPLMLWSLREEARNYIEAGATSLEKHKLAFEIMQEGRRNLCWQN